MTRDSVFQGTGIDDGDKCIEICWVARDAIDFLESPSSCLFSNRWTKDFSYLIGANFSDPKTGRCALTNHRSPGYPLGTDLSNYAQ